VVRAADAFRITSVECEDPRFCFEVGPTAKSLHLVPVTFQAGAEPGPVAAKIRIHTDLSGGKTAELTASGSVLP